LKLVVWFNNNASGDSARGVRYSGLMKREDDYLIPTITVEDQWLLLNDNEPSRFIQEVTGKIAFEDDDGIRLHAGEIHLFVVDVEGATSEREDAFAVFDTHRDTMRCFEALYETDGFGSVQLKESVDKLLDMEGLWRPNVLLLDRLTILPKFRNHGLGLEVLRRAILRYRIGTGIVALYPFPLQFEGRPKAEEKASLGLSEFTCSMDYAKRKLRRHYGKLGFKLHRPSGYMVMNSEMPIEGRRI